MKSKRLTKQLVGILLLSFILTLSSLPLAAQDNGNKPKARWGITAGVNGYNAHTLNLSDDRGRWGGHLGVKLEKPLSTSPNHWYLDGEAKLLLLRTHEQGVYYFNDFLSEHTAIHNYASDTKMDAYYLHIPIHAGYKWTFNDRFALFVDAGPYVAMGLFGKTKCTGSINGEAGVESSYDTFKHHLNRNLEWGVGMKLGVELYKHYQLGVSYDYGISRIHYAQHAYDRNANLTFFISYMF
mgnify:FL=1